MTARPQRVVDRTGSNSVTRSSLVQATEESVSHARGMRTQPLSSTLSLRAVNKRGLLSVTDRTEIADPSLAASGESYVDRVNIVY